MQSRSSGKSLPTLVAGAIAVGVIAAVGTFLTYRHTLDYGFDYDDYVLTRPFTAAEVRHALHGSWDTTGVMVPFYRPLTVAFYAARFEVFGLNSRGHHALSLAMFALAATLCGWFAWLATRRAFGGVVATLLFVIHPAMPYAQVAWPTNQMHLLESLVVLSGLLWWNCVRARPFAWWLPLLRKMASCSCPPS